MTCNKCVALWRRGKRGLGRYGARGVLKFVISTSLESLRRRFGKGVAEGEGELFDRQHQIDTTVKPHDAADLMGVDSENWVHGIAYMPSEPERFHSLMRHLPIRFEDYTFIDYGSGKGRAILMAANYPFKEIMGVEYSSYLHEIAEQNIAHHVGPTKKCEKIRSIRCDAAQFAIPAGQVVHYFANPFDEPVMKQVARNIIDSLQREPCRLFVVYYNAVCANVFLEHGFLEVTRQMDKHGVHLILECSRS